MKDKGLLKKIVKKSGNIFEEIAAFFLVIIGIITMCVTVVLGTIVMGVVTVFQFLLVIPEYIRYFIVDTCCDMKYGRKEDKK